MFWLRTILTNMTTMTKNFTLGVLFCFYLSLAVQAQSLTEDPEARRIFNEMDQRRDKITYETSEMQMVIYDSRGRTRNRLIRSYNYNQEKISYSLLIFLEPASVRGTGFLTLSERSEETQKLYLPALERIRMISASEKSDRFMGSDFTYEDLGDQDPDDYRFEYLAREDSSHLLKAVKIQESQYAWIHFYIDPDRYVLRQAEFFDEDGNMIKRLEAGEHRKVMEEVWRPNRMVMHDLRNDRKTELNWNNRVIGDPIPQWRFTERGIRRGIQ